MWELLLLQSPVMVPENLLMFCRRVVDDVNDRPVGNPKIRCDEHSSKFFSVMKPRFINPVGKSQTQEGDAC
jgi:hypothetical protein